MKQKRDPNVPEQARTACGGVLHEPERYPSAEYRGQRVYFCTMACLEAYSLDPDRFMEGEIEHPQ